VGPDGSAGRPKGAPAAWAWFVGLATLDVVQQVSDWPGPNDKVTATWHEISAGGPATNAALAHAALGGSARLTTGLGRGTVGEAIRGTLESRGVAVQDLADHNAVPALSSILLTEGTADRTIVSTDGTGMGVRIPDREADLEGCGALLVDGHHPELALWAARQARAAGVRVIVDAGRWKPVMAELLGLADDVVCSSDFRMPGVDGPDALLAGLISRGVRRAAITRGEDSVLWAERHADGTASGTGRLAVDTVPAVDTLGAGDVFHGAYAHAVARGGVAFAEALRFAAEAAGERVQVRGQVAWLERLSGFRTTETATR
jgi:sugar/nucleoside kinase (ribokinase family)